MCGITGYIGDREALPILISSLKKLEYRGYDSCGLVLLGSNISVFKDIGRIGELQQGVPSSKASIGIGHTRWATHGKPSKANAHPHVDCTGNIAVVHNGVISNYQKLKEKLIAEKHTFVSETDTEVIVHLIESHYHGDLLAAVRKALKEIVGSYAIAVVANDCDTIIVARYESPLVIGVGDREFLVASDVTGILEHTQRVIYLEDGDVGTLSRGEIKIYNAGSPVDRQEQKITWNTDEAQRGGYEHFMLKEIHEQPKMISEMVRQHNLAVKEQAESFSLAGVDFDNILFLACGSSYYASLVGKYIIEKLAHIPVQVSLASEFNYTEPVLKRTLAIAVTQSGETADTVKALRKVKDKGFPTFAITNVLSSSISRLSDQTFYTMAGPEISVAATKSFTAQLIALYLLSLSLNNIDITFRRRFIDDLRKLSDGIDRVLLDQKQIIEFGKYMSRYQHVFFLGRGLNMPVALEGALKMKEISYVHAEGLAAGELKHGPIALLGPDMPVVAIVTNDSTYEIMLGNIKEVKARNTTVIAIASEKDTEIKKYVDHVIQVPEVNPLLSPVVNAVTLQLLAYYTAKELGRPIDMPRNLAKSVTVE